MPRNYSQLDIDPNSDVRGDEIPDLTLDNAAELITDCDYVMVSVSELMARRFYKQKYVESRGRDGGTGTEQVTSNRHCTIFTEFIRRFDHLTPDDEPSSVSTPGMRHYKIIPDETTVFNDIKRFITDMAPLWRLSCVFFCLIKHHYPKASTINYDIAEHMPPLPPKKAFQS